MPTLDCPECGRGIATHELQTRTVARSTGFDTAYRCPHCRSDFDDVSAFR